MSIGYVSTIYFKDNQTLEDIAEAMKTNIMKIQELFNKEFGIKIENIKVNL